MSEEGKVSAPWRALNAATWVHRGREMPPITDVCRTVFTHRGPRRLRSGWIPSPGSKLLCLCLLQILGLLMRFPFGGVSVGCNLLLTQHGKPLRFRFYLLVWLVAAVCNGSPQKGTACSLNVLKKPSHRLTPPDHWLLPSVSFSKTDIPQKVFKKEPKFWPTPFLPHLSQNTFWRYTVLYLPTPDSSAGSTPFK